MNKIIFKNQLAALILCCLSVTANCFADGITIEHASGRIKDSFYQIDANISYELSESVQDALLHGIALRFDTIIEIMRERNWVWDKNLGATILSFQLEYLPLSNNYLVTNIITGKRTQHPMLEEALSALGTIKNFPVYSESGLNPERNYNCRIMSELRIRNLPLPLQPLALLSPSWKLSSNWYEWTIR